MKKECKIYDLFLQQIFYNKEKVAVVFDGNSITYGELEEKINDFSIILMQKKIYADANIVIALPPSIDFVIAMFACFKLGYAYIPIDLSYPESFLKTIIDKSKADYIISAATYKHRLEKLANFFIDVNDESPKNTIQIDDLIKTNSIAYIIYTSASTGIAKGVIIENNGLVNLIQATKQLYNITSCDCIPLVHSLSFDFSIWEICSALCNGAQLIIPNSTIKKSTEEYLEFLIDKKITILNTTPSFFYLMQTTILSKPSNILEQLKLRLVIFGGEALQPKKISSWFTLAIADRVKVFNMFGITEGTIHSTYIEITQEITKNEASVIGVPLPGIDIAIMHEESKLVSDHQIGELYLGGVSIAQGYLHEYSLNKEKFYYADLDSAGIKRWFKTGDLVKRCANGLEYIDRKDRLIKIRGFRVNCTQIENLLHSYPEVESAVVGTYLASDDMPRLVAFLKFYQKNIDKQLFERKIIENLPEFMRPSKIIIVKEFPLTNNNKTDLKYLIEKYINSPINAIADDFIEEKILSTTMEKVKMVWEKVLNITTININDKFFDIGGDSLLLIKLQSELQISLNREVRILDLVKFPAIKGFVDYLNSHDLK